jgi:hypothetical protein
MVTLLCFFALPCLACFALPCLPDGDAFLLAVHLEDDDSGGNIPFDPVEHGDDDGNAAFDFNEHDDDDDNGGFDLNEPVHDEHANGTTSFSSLAVQIECSSFVAEIFMFYFL